MEVNAGVRGVQKAVCENEIADSRSHDKEYDRECFLLLVFNPNDQ